MANISSIIQENLSTKYSNVNTGLSSTSTTGTTSTTNTAKTSSKKATSLLSDYLQNTPEENVDSRTVFKKLSFDVGGDGSTVTKDGLASYISEAEKGTVQTSDNQLSSLKTLYNNWNEISGGDDSINYGDVFAAGYKDTLVSMSSSGVNNDDADATKVTLSSTQQSNMDLVTSATSGTNYDTYSSNGTLSSSSVMSTVQNILGSTNTSDLTSDETKLSYINQLLGNP